VLLWDAGDLGHASRHGVSREEIDAMYDGGRWVVAEDPFGRPDQERLVGEVPGSGRLITLALEWVTVSPRRGAPRRWRRPISAWEARPHEAAFWREDFGDG
jgi:hypothetical protein